VIKTGTVELVVPRGRLSSVVNQLTSMSAGFGGYPSDTKSTEGSAAPTADVTLRVPSNQFEAALAKIRTLGTTMSVTTSGQDVTSQYVDLQARITSLQAARDQYLLILHKASAIGDILAVQQQLDSIQTQLEQLQGQLNVLDKQTSYSTLAVHVAEPESAAHVPGHRSGLAKAWADARHSFSHGAESVVSASGGIAVFLLCAGLLLLAGRAGWALIRRRLV
jgi:hypothetical protein